LKEEEEDDTPSTPKEDEKVDEKTDTLKPDEDNGDLIIVVVGETSEKSTSMRNK
jgi:hypothetical protein